MYDEDEPDVAEVKTVLVDDETEEDEEELSVHPPR
jgi:hypothetical protein